MKLDSIARVAGVAIILIIFVIGISLAHVYDKVKFKLEERFFD